ncbi:MAG: retropepsin-like aspartic protease [Bacteroidota bacterium]
MKQMIVMLLLLPMFCSAQDYYLPLQKDPFSGLYHLNVALNDVNGKFIFDTGASGIVVNGVFFNRLMSQGKISQADYKGPVQSIIADGSVVNGSRYNIQNLKAGNLELFNVEVTVMPQSNAGMLIGQTFLAKFGKVTLDLDNERLVLEKKVFNPNTAVALSEIRLIPCFTTSEKFDDLKTTLNATGIRIDKYTQEDKVPPANALQRINSSYTIRYFDAQTENLSIKFSEEIARTNPGSSVTTEDMRPYFNGANIPAYIEIWIK